MANTVIQVETGNIDVTPYYMAKLAHDVFFAANSYSPVETKSRSQRNSWYKYFLYCVSIEIALKAVLLNNNNTLKRKKKNKKIGHNLSKLRAAVSDSLPVGFFDSVEVEAIDKAAPFFRSKALEYLSSELLMQMVTGGKDLPDIEILERAANKVVGFLERKDYFIRSDTQP